MKKPAKILLVEDEAFISLALVAELREGGYEVIEPVATGEEAIQVDGELLPDIIFMDIRLAGDMDGIEAARQIQAHRAVPIAFMTGYASSDEQKRTEELRSVAYLVKPVEMYQIIEVIESVMRDGGTPQSA